MTDAVRIEGLADLRKDLRAMQPDARREVTKALKEGATIVAKAAGPFTARRSGKMAGMWRAGASGNTAYARNPHPGAGVQEFGGVIRPKGTPITIRPHPAGTRALEQNQERIVNKVGDAIDAVAGRHGWH